MDRLQIPYENVLHHPLDFDKDEFNSLLRRQIEDPEGHPVMIEVFNRYIQYLLFIRERMLYWAGVNRGDGFRGINIRDLFISLKRTQFPQIITYRSNLLLFHSMLVYLQKKPDLKVNSSLVDLDEILDKYERRKKSALITAYQPGNFLILRYRKGRPAACFSENTIKYCRDSNVREEFLVRVYTLSSHHPFELNTFEDLSVTHARDSKSVPRDYQGTISSYFLQLPPRLVVKLKGRPLKTYTFTGKSMTIGRHRENDIVIDNLSVSRKHARINHVRGEYILTDLQSKNGTRLQGEPVEEAKLSSGDVITVGKYQVVFKTSSAEEQRVDELDQTVIIPGFHNREQESSMNINCPLSAETNPVLYRRSNHKCINLINQKTTIGRGSQADIKLGGFLTPREIALIAKVGDDYIFRKTSSRRKIRINGEETEEKVLEEEDLIAIGKEEFVFKY